MVLLLCVVEYKGVYNVGMVVVGFICSLFSFLVVACWIAEKSGKALLEDHEKVD